MNLRRYSVMTSKTSGAKRLSWLSPASEEMFCGICLRAKTAEFIDDHCPICQASISATFEVVPGGRTGRPILPPSPENYIVTERVLERVAIS